MEEAAVEEEQEKEGKEGLVEVWFCRDRSSFPTVSLSFYLKVMRHRLSFIIMRKQVADGLQDENTSRCNQKCLCLGLRSSGTFGVFWTYGGVFEDIWTWEPWWCTLSPEFLVPFGGDDFAISFWMLCLIFLEYNLIKKKIHKFFYNLWQYRYIFRDISLQMKEKLSLLLLYQ